MGSPVRSITQIMDSLPEEERVVVIEYYDAAFKEGAKSGARLTEAKIKNNPEYTVTMGGIAFYAVLALMLGGIIGSML